MQLLQVSAGPCKDAKMVKPAGVRWHGCCTPQTEELHIQAHRNVLYCLCITAAVMTLHIMILDHYNCRQRLKSISLQKTFTVEEQEIRNLYEFYYPDDSESKKIAALTQ